MKLIIKLSLVNVLVATLFVNPAFAASKKIKTQSPANSAQILSTIVALDANEILAGVQASNKNPSWSVSDFAKMMVKDHGKNMTEALELANQTHSIPLNPNPDNLHDKGAKELVMLAPLSGDAYNKAYVDAMVKGHEAALSTIDNKLMKSASNADIKNFLTDTRAAVAHHLEEAQKLQKKLNG
jgi:putative membrane protein